MPDASRFTLSLFDTNPAVGFAGDGGDGLLSGSALGWTVPVPAAEAWPAPPATESDDSAEPEAPKPAVEPRGANFHLHADRALARGWPARARDNIAAIRLSKELEASGRIPTTDEQSAGARLVLLLRASWHRWMAGYGDACVASSGSSGRRRNLEVRQAKDGCAAPFIRSNQP